MNAPIAHVQARTAPDPLALPALLARASAAACPRPGHAMLLDALHREGAPDFSPRLSRGGWYRPGRILAAEGMSVAEDALAWLERAWADAGSDPLTFAERHAESGFLVTRIEGVTHYLVAPYGSGPADFLQLEVEELQEKVSHPLFARTEPADSVESLLTRPEHIPPPLPMEQAQYGFRRVTDISAYLGRIARQPGRPAPVLRFLEEWAASSSGQQALFCSHWVLGLAEHPDRHGELRASAVPVATRAPRWEADSEARGIDLARQLQAFDEAAGFDFAWYFHLVSGHRVPRSVLPRVFTDLTDGLTYLPERDARLVAGWMKEPYSL